VEYLTFSKMSPDPGNMGPLAEWLPEALWPKLKGLESMKVFQGLGDTMQGDSDMWQHWFDNEQPENAALPGDFKHIVPFHALILLRAVRPDRIPSALRKYISDNMGVKYVSQSPFDMKSTYAETSPLTPVFFVLFPGVDPTTWVESLGEDLGISSERGNFTNISMGQGQEGPAEKIVKKYAEEG
jgi:dynein heavy chain